VDHVGGLLADGLRRRLRPDVPIQRAVGRVAVAGDVFRFVPADWEY